MSINAISYPTILKLTVISIDHLSLNFSFCKEDILKNSRLAKLNSRSSFQADFGVFCCLYGGFFTKTK